MPTSHGVNGPRRYVASRRYDYSAVDEYLGNSCLRTVRAGIKPRRVADDLADNMNLAYWQGTEDLLKDLHNAITTLPNLTKDDLSRVVEILLSGHDPDDVYSAVAAIEDEKEGN